MNKFLLILYVLFTFSDVYATENECSGAISGFESQSDNQQPEEKPELAFPAEIIAELPAEFTLKDAYTLLARLESQSIHIGWLAETFFGTSVNTLSDPETIKHSFQLNILLQEQIDMRRKELINKKLTKLSEIEKQDFFFSTFLSLEYFLKKSKFYVEDKHLLSESELFSFSNSIQVGIIMSLIRLGEMSKFISILSSDMVYILTQLRHSLVHGYIHEMNDIYRVLNDILLLFSHNKSFKKSPDTAIAKYVVKNVDFLTDSYPLRLNYEAHLDQVKLTVGKFMRLDNGQFINSESVLRAFNNKTEIPKPNFSDLMIQFLGIIFNSTGLLSSLGFDSLEIVKRQKNTLILLLIKFGDVAAQVKKMKETDRTLNPYKLWLIEKLNFIDIVRERNDAVHFNELTEESLSSKILSNLVFINLSILVNDEMGGVGYDIDYGTHKDLNAHLQSMSMHVGIYYKHLFTVHQNHFLLKNGILDIQNMNDDVFSKYEVELATFSDQLLRKMFMNFVMPQIRTEAYWKFFNGFLYLSKIENPSDKFDKADADVSRFIDEKFLNDKMINIFYNYFIGKKTNLILDEGLGPGVLKRTVSSELVKLYEENKLGLEDSMKQVLDLKSSQLLNFMQF